MHRPGGPPKKAKTPAAKKSRRGQKTGWAKDETTRAAEFKVSIEKTRQIDAALFDPDNSPWTGLKRKGITSEEIELRQALLDGMGLLPKEGSAYAKHQAQIKRLVLALEKKMPKTESGRNAVGTNSRIKEALKKIGIGIKESQIHTILNRAKVERTAMQRLAQYLKEHPGATLEHVQSYFAKVQQSAKHYESIGKMWAEHHRAHLEKKPLNEDENYYLAHRNNPQTRAFKHPRFSVDPKSGEVIPVWERVGRVMRQRNEERQKEWDENPEKMKRRTYFANWFAKKKRKKGDE